MAKNPKLIDNQRKKLVDILNNNANDYQYLSIATGYWDLEGTLDVIDKIKNYKSIRLLIGQEPIPHYLGVKSQIFCLTCIHYTPCFF
ncbi:MAG: hypothetical protein LBL60_03580 [Mycoplasmataceae bacterium]|nr:hypothetical protein [Mycoplasmataceae bacterium]